MTDYSKMSDAELLSRYKAATQQTQEAKPSIQATNAQNFADKRTTDSKALKDPKEMTAKEIMEELTGAPLDETSIGQDILQGVATVGDFLDRYTTAPARAAAQEFKESLQMPRGLLKAPGLPQSAPPLTKAVVRAGQKLVETFGDDPDQQPTGRDVISGLGISKEKKFDLPVFGPTSPEDIAAAGATFFLDISGFIPVAAPAKLLARGAKATGKAALKGSAAAAEGVGRAVGLSTPIDIVKQAGKGAKLAYNDIFRPTQAKDFPELLRIAEKNGIEIDKLPEAIEFGERSTIATVARGQRDLPGGDEAINSFIGQLDNVKRKTLEKINEIGGGVTLNKIDAGNLIRADYDRAVDEFFNSLDVSYNSIIKNNPGLKLSDAAMSDLESKLKGIETFAKGRVARGVTQLQRAQGQGLLNSINAIRNTNGSVKQTVEALRDIGEAAFKSQNTMAAIPADVAKMRSLYGDISKSLRNTIRTEIPNGAEIEKALIVNNKLMTDFFGDKSLLENTIGKATLSPEGVFKNLIENGDSQKIQALKNILSPEAMQNLKGALISSLIKETDDGFRYSQLASKMRTKKMQLQQLLTDSELQDLSELVNFGQRFGDLHLNYSNTGVLEALKNIPGTILSRTTNEGFLEGLKAKARGRTLRQLQAPAAKTGLQIPMRRGIKERVFIQTPQQISAQQRNQQLEE